MRLANEGIFVDESGDFGLTNRSKRFATVGFVYSKNPSLLRKKLRRLLKRYHFKNKYPRHLSELKFMLPYSELIQKDYSVEDLNNIYSPQMPKLRSEALTIIRDNVDGVYAAILDKPSRTSSTWTTETIGNFVFVETFYVNILNQLRLPNPPLVYYDKGRLSFSKMVNFATYFTAKDRWLEYKDYKMYKGRVSPPLDVSSVLEPCIWAADLVAGAFYHKYHSNEWAYASIVKSKMICPEERYFWKN